MDFRAWLNLAELAELEESFPGLTFGVEIEIPFQSAGEWEYSSVSTEGMELFDKLRLSLKWTAKYDDTCLPGIEVVTDYPNSGIPAQARNFAQLEADINTMAQHFAPLVGDMRPQSCGTHIHVGGMDEDTKHAFAQLWYKKVQGFVPKMVPAARYEKMKNPYSSIALISSANILMAQLKQFIVAFREYGTIEFRGKEATLNGGEVRRYTMLACKLVYKAKELNQAMQQTGNLSNIAFLRRMQGGGVDIRNLEKQQ